MCLEADGRMWMNRTINETGEIWSFTARGVISHLESEGRSNDFIRGAIQELNDRKMSI